MNRNAVVGVLLILMVIMSGCTTMVTQSQPSGPLGVKIAAPMRADIEVGEKISGAASGTILCGCIPIGLPDKFAEGVDFNYRQAWYPAGPLGSFGEFAISSIRAGAAYEAISKSKADVIVAPRYIIEDNNMVIFRTVNITVIGYKGTIKGFKPTENFKEQF